MNRRRRYAAEFDVASAKKNVPGMPEHRIALLMAKAFARSLKNLAALVASGASLRPMSTVSTTC